MKKQVFLSLLITLLINVNYAQFNWQQIGPQGGFVKCLAANANSLYAGTSNGVYISTNNGTTWSNYSSGLENLYILSLAVDGDTLYAGTELGLFKSINNGISWFRIGINIIIAHAALLSYEKNKLLVSDFLNNLYYSGDNGITWTILNSGISNTITALHISDNKFYVGTEYGGLYTSTDYGSTWNNANTGMTATSVYSITKTDTILFLATDNGIFKSNNKGVSWITKNTGITQNYLLHLHSSNDLLITSTASGTFFVSTNNGEQWNQVNTGYTHNSIQNVFTHNNNLFIATLVYGILKSSDQGTTWAESNNGIMSQISMKTTLDDSTIYACNGFIIGGSNLFSSTNKGTSWNKIQNTFSDQLVSAIAVKDEKICVGSSWDGGVYVTTDTGITWNHYFPGIATNENMVNILHTIDSNLYAGTRKGLWKSTNFGINWVIMDTIFSNSNITAITSNKNEIYVGGANIFNGSLEVFFSNDYGNTWSKGGIASIDPEINSIIIKDTLTFLSTDDDIYLTSNKGNTWTQIPFPPTSFYNQTILKTDGNNIFALSEGILYSSNNGATWNELNMGWDTPYGCLDLIFTKNEMFVTTVNAGLWKRNRDISTVSAKDSYIQINKINCFPNPFTKTTTIEYNLDKTQDVTIEIINLLCEVIYSRHLGSQSEGKNTLNLELTTKGVYQVILKTEKQLLSQKLISY